MVGILQMIFTCISLNENYGILINILLICTSWSIWQYVTVGLDNGLSPIYRQAINCTNDDPDPWPHMVRMG